MGPMSHKAEIYMGLYLLYGALYSWPYDYCTGASYSWPSTYCTGVSYSGPYTYCTGALMVLKILYNEVLGVHLKPGYNLACFTTVSAGPQIPNGQQILLVTLALCELDAQPFSAEKENYTVIKCILS